MGTPSGRDKPLADLDALRYDLTDARAETIMAVSGMAGVGKTTLAVQWAHRVRDGIPDGQIYVDLRGYDVSGSPVPPAEVIRTVLEALGVAADRMPAGSSERTSLYQRLLADRRILLILDNARDADQVRSLLPGTPTVRILVTSRDPLAGLVVSHGARPLHVGLFDTNEAWELLERGFGRDRMTAEPSAVRDIIAICSGLPLALAVASARVAVHPQFSLTELVAELRGRDGPLTTLAGEDPTTDLRSLFSWSYRALDGTAAALFRRLGLHWGPDVSVAAVADVAARPATDARALLSEIARAQLIVEHRPGRYAMHDLVRAYAADLVRGQQPAADNDATVSATLRFYLRTAFAGDRLLDPVRTAVAPPPPGPGPAPLPDAAAALAWFAAERDVLLAALADAPPAAGVGWHQARLGMFQQALTSCQEALRLLETNGNQRVRALTLHSVGYAHHQLGHYGEAVRCYQNALLLYREQGDRYYEADTMAHLGDVHAGAGDATAARQVWRQALRILDDLHHPDAERVRRRLTEPNGTATAHAP